MTQILILRWRIEQRLGNSQKDFDIVIVELINLLTIRHRLRERKGALRYSIHTNCQLSATQATAKVIASCHC